MSDDRPTSPARAARLLWREISFDAVGDLAAGLSYRFLFALFPFFIFLASLGAFAAGFLGIDNPSTEIVRRIAVALPGDARSLLTTQLEEILGDQQAGLASVAIIGALWAASGGMSAAMRAMNIAYDIEETRPFWKRTGIAIGLTLLGGALLIVAFVASVAAEAIAVALGLEHAYQLATVLLRVVVPIVLLTGAAAVLFWAAPNVRLPFKWITPGAVLFVATWVVGTAAFSFYVSRFGSYNATYGALGALIVLMLWFYLSAFTMLAGAELNAILARDQAEDPAVIGPAESADAPQPVQGRAAVSPAGGPEGLQQLATAQRRGLAASALGVIVAAATVWRATPWRAGNQPRSS